MKLHKIASVLIFSISSIFTASSAYSVTIQQTVDAHDNLFYTDWGHWFTSPSDHGLAEPGSQAASAVPFNFGGFNSISISATGLAVQDIYATYTPDGVCVSQCESALYQGELRVAGLPAYSLIGIWSRSATEIDPFYTGDQGLQDINSGLGLLFIGSGRNLAVPSFASSAYLFLAVNDGGFGDNSGEFNVTINATPNAVPLPGALIFMSSGLVALLGIRRRAV